MKYLKEDKVEVVTWAKTTSFGGVVFRISVITVAFLFVLLWIFNIFYFILSDDTANCLSLLALIK